MPGWKRVESGPGRHRQLVRRQRISSSRSWGSRSSRRSSVRRIPVNARKRTRGVVLGVDTTDDDE